jgi:DNA polymerase (family 10)
MIDADPDTPFVTNAEIAHILFRIASLLDLVDDNEYRVRAYRRAAFRVLLLAEPLVDYVHRGEEPPLHGVGPRIRARLIELLNTGHMGVYEALLEDVGEPVASLLHLHGVGPKTAIRLVRDLHIGSLTELADAAREGRIRMLRGFGAKREAQLGRLAEEALVGVA